MRTIPQWSTCYELALSSEHRSYIACLARAYRSLVAFGQPRTSNTIDNVNRATLNRRLQTVPVGRMELNRACIHMPCSHHQHHNCQPCMCQRCTGRIPDKPRSH